MSVPRTEIGDVFKKQHTKRYKVKKTGIIEEHNNQSNKWNGETWDLFNRSRPLTTSVNNDSRPKYRYKSYDYNPAKYNSQQFVSPRYARDKISQDLSDSADNLEDNNKHRFKPSNQHIRQYSSNEELDNSRTNDCSSEYSQKYSYKPSNKSYGDCDLKCYNTKSYYNSIPHRPKQMSFSNSSANYHGNSVARKTYNERLQSENNRSPRIVKPDNDSYLRRSDEAYSNPMILKSTFRTDENIPHSGTRLEYHRNQLDKYCRGKPNSRYNESNNVDNTSHYHSKVMSRNSTGNKCTLPQSPRHSNQRKQYGQHKNALDDFKNRFSTEQKTDRRCEEPISDNESGYFESCRNSNNEYFSKLQKDLQKKSREFNESISDCPSSSSTQLSNEKPAETTQKLGANIKSLNNPCIKESKSNINHSPKKNRGSKPPSSIHRHSCHSSRHRTSDKGH